MGQNQHARETDLHIIENGTLRAVRYVNEILDVYVRPYAGVIGADFILRAMMGAHTEHTSLTYIWKILPSLEWTGQLTPPDMNLIEHAWHMLQKEISAHPVQQTTVPQLRTALEEEGARLPKQQLGRLISSMRRRC